MPSPFSIFRKHQKVLMVALTILAMFAFVVMDQLQPGRTEQTLPVFGMLLGGVIFWLIGSQTGKGGAYAATGAVLGLALGLWAPRYFAPAPAVVTKAGDLSHRDLQNLVARRHNANAIMAEAFRRIGVPQGRPRFHFGSPDITQDVVTGYLLANEADALGIRISDEAVIRFLNEELDGKLSPRGFVDIRSRLRMSESEVIDTLRHEIKAQMALNLSAPNVLPTPGDYYETYRKLNIRQELEVAAVPLDPFAADVPVPSEPELVAFFEAHREVFRHQRGPGEPGFRQPDRVRAAWLEADFEDFLAKVDQPTEEEIRDFYEEHKERRFRNLTRTIPSDEEDGRHFPDDELFPGDLPADEAPITDEGPTEAPFPRSRPAEPDDETGPPADEASRPESPVDEAVPEDGAPPAEDRELSDEQASAGGPAFAGTVLTVPTALLDEELRDEDAPVAAGETEAGGPGAADSPPGDELLEDASPDAPAEPQAPAEEAAAADDASGDDAPDAPALDAPRRPDAPDLPDEAPAERPEFQPLDEVREQIRRELEEMRADALMSEVMDEALSRMLSLGQELRVRLEDIGPRGRITPRTVADSLRQFADQRGLRYVETDLLSAEEMSDVDLWPIGAAREPTDDPTRARSVLEILFTSDSGFIYQPFQAEAIDGTRYAAWKIEHVDQRIPESIDEPGVREQVVEQWKTQEARPRAEQRAEALAARARGTSLEEALAGETVTGEDEGLELTVRHTEPFTWLRRSSAPHTGLVQDLSDVMPRVSSISAIGQPGEEFMRHVFDRLGNGEVGVVPNADRTVYYVVRVVNRSPATPADERALYQEFLNEELRGSVGFVLRPQPSQQYIPSAYEIRVREMQMAAMEQWAQRLQEKYAVEWNVELAGRR